MGMLKIVVGMSSLLAVAGCQSCAESAIEAASGGKVKIDASGGTMTVNTPEGKAKIEMGNQNGGEMKVTGTNADGSQLNATFGAGGKMPAGFPLAAMDGLNIMTGGVAEKNGKKSYGVTGQTAKPAAVVADFYEAELKKAGLAVTRNTMNMNGINTIVLEGKTATGKLAVSAMEQGGQTMVQMGGEP